MGFERLYQAVCNKKFVDRIKSTRYGFERFTEEQIRDKQLPSYKDENFLSTIESETDNMMKQDWSTQRNLCYKFGSKQRDNFGEHDICPCCWVTVNRCYCNNFISVTGDDMNKPSPLLDDRKIKTNLCVYMHTREFYRSSNTAKVMLSSIEGSDLFISGLAKHEQELEAEYWRKTESGEKNVAILYPSEDALTFEEYFKKQSENKKPIEEFTLFVLDGTWGNARNLHRRVPSYVPRIKITPPTDYQNLFSTLRQQTSQDRISTLEATNMGFREIYGQDSPTCNVINDNLKIMINEIKKLNGRKDEGFAPKRPVGEKKTKNRKKV
ncbi:hypothetical protein AKO1_008181 [Acrasis kona]|uniref:tRNA-uridine aminocarboxypropyltransferase n=1 Tax=Acrasis kona TaxID=1008807 RepID=A0AAW2YLZ3_9EUKA